ncbi:MAG: hypothetical protein A2Y62_14795 [Candidatus Fischerbacteria bacterium RBG_13_37_8]|uniref:Uncharacterized protein n=1 Tax=Candidatus Fischerbacteria bacterium RBG_13_37_8 TaxID=1817863 RepID=A0A1F5VMS6_9BACT|nr:MAG: hypothetical protein A2Y62_14795 [Candidatus Fischerbacteria bacterium RBG_13_37_8]
MPLCLCAYQRYLKFQISLVRIKSSEKFWNKSSVKAVVKIKASLLSQDDSYQQFWNNRYDNQVKMKRHYRKFELKKAS